MNQRVSSSPFPRGSKAAKNEVVAFSRLETCPSNVHPKYALLQQLGLRRSALHLSQDRFATTTSSEEYDVNTFVIYKWGGEVDLSIRVLRTSDPY